MHCECLRGKQTRMNYFLRLYDQVGQDVGHRQENLPKAQGSYLAAAGHEAGANRHKLQNTTLDLKRKLLEMPETPYALQLPSDTSCLK